MQNKLSRILLALLLVLSVLVSFVGCEAPNEAGGGSENSGNAGDEDNSDNSGDSGDSESEDNSGSGAGDNDSAGGSGAVSEFDLSIVPAYSGNIFYVINDNKPFFEDEDIVTESYESYGELDSLGRCTAAIACVGVDIMPTEDRGDINSVTPTGWIQAKYDCVSGTYLYNRCHLIGYQLTGENANEKNLVTGTRELNNEGMLPFENMIADYIKETENHVMYRVTPVFDENDLVVRGILLEAYSVEDEGDGICFNVFIYNVQPGIVIDYATGASRLATDAEGEGSEGGGNDSGSSSEIDPSARTYVINTKTKKYHTLTHYTDLSEYDNLEYTTLTEEQLLDLNYEPCGTCKP